MFEGLLRNETCCSACGTVTARDEPFLALSLDLADCVSVAWCLRRLSEPETLSEPFMCDSPVCAGKLQPAAKKRQLIVRSPRVLVLHLKRFRYIAERRGFVKVRPGARWRGI